MERSRWIDFLINRHAKPLVRYANALSMDASVARVLVHDTFLSLLKQENTVDRNKTQAWLFRECRKLAHEFQNKKRAAEGLPAGAIKIFPVPVLPTEGEPNSATEVDPLAYELSQLPADQQEALWLKYKEELSLQQIGEVMEIGSEKAASLLYESSKHFAQIESDPNSHPPVSKLQLMAYVHGELENEDAQLVPQLIQQNLETHREAEELKSCHSDLAELLAERARLGLLPSQIAALQAYVPRQPMNWGPWALAAGLTAISLMIFSVVSNEFSSDTETNLDAEPHVDSRASAFMQITESGAAKASEAKMSTAIPIELQREFSTPASMSPVTPRTLNTTTSEPRAKAKPGLATASKKVATPSKRKATTVSKRDSAPKTTATKSKKNSRKK